MNFYKMNNGTSYNLLESFNSGLGDDFENEANRRILARLRHLDVYLDELQDAIKNNNTNDIVLNKSKIKGNVEYLLPALDIRGGVEGLVNYLENTDFDFMNNFKDNAHLLLDNTLSESDSNYGLEWSYFDKFDSILDKYLPERDEGDTLATQIVTAINKLIYKWYNDGDVYDNTYDLSGWVNDLSDYANWLYTYVPETKSILERVYSAGSESEYTDILKSLADLCLNDKFLVPRNEKKKMGSIYNCKGPFRFVEKSDEDEDNEY